APVRPSGEVQASECFEISSQAGEIGAANVRALRLDLAVPPTYLATELPILARQPLLVVPLAEVHDGSTALDLVTDEVFITFRPSDRQPLRPRRGGVQCLPTEDIGPRVVVGEGLG